MKNWNWKLLGLAAFLLAGLFLTYSNHFDNGFHFDDSHTIVDNEYIRDIRNIPKFFYLDESRSTLPTNRAYRPMVAVLNTVDYWLGGGLNPVYFHASMFLWYIIQCVLLFFIFRKIIDYAHKHPWNDYFALFITAFYAFHTGNAETLNYIISRSDLFSTMLIVASLGLYMNKRTRRFHLYLITLIISLLTKQTGVMFFPILFAYIMIFEENLTVPDLVLFRQPKKTWSLLKKVAPTAIVGVVLFMLILVELNPTKTIFQEKAGTRWEYFMTQQFVMLRYWGNFFLPINLSPDQTINIMKNFLDQRILFGLIFNAGLVVTAIVLMGKRRFKPVAFGLFWFYFALVPTSSFHVLAQVSNDHRIFFPYIGAALAVGWLMVLLFQRYEDQIVRRRWRLGGAAFAALLLLFGYAYGAHSRNEVWSSGDSIWADAAKKGPENGRALMNHGLTLMRKGEYKKAAEYFDRAEEKLPRWAYIHINQGILKNATGDAEAAEAHFKKAIRYQGFNPEGYYFYARFLYGKGRTDEALAQLRKGLEVSPGHAKSREYIRFIEAAQGKTSSIEDMLENDPSANNFLNLSLAYYKAREFELSIEMAEKALELNPNSPQAYNNICSANCSLKRWDAAIEACGKALEIDPDFQRAKNNLKWAVNGKAKEEAGE